MIEALKLDDIPVSERFMMMEALWSNLSENIDNSNFTPQWHLDILNEREKLIKSGDMKFSSLDEVGERLQKRYNAN